MSSFISLFLYVNLYLHVFILSHPSPSVIKNALGKWFEIRHPSIVSLYSISQERGKLPHCHFQFPFSLYSISSFYASASLYV